MLRRPAEERSWPEGNGLIAGTPYDIDAETAAAYLSRYRWQPPERDICFFTDLHADALAFHHSLFLAGLVPAPSPPVTLPLTLNAAAFEVDVLIGGDCFDKGPDVFALLDMVADLQRQGVRLRLLAGNHDLRTLLGFQYALSQQPLEAHLFCRMGAKVLPLLKSLIRKNPSGQTTDFPDPDILAQQILPGTEWEPAFRSAASPWFTAAQLEKEIAAVRRKVQTLRPHLAALGWRNVAMAIEQFRAYFLTPEGRYGWFFPSLNLVERQGSLLFLHAGVDDQMAAMIAQAGTQAVNSLFREQLQTSPFDLYHNAVGNLFRTKYRRSDLPFTADGSQLLHDKGIHALVHGHRKQRLGQRMMLRAGMLNLACDASVDKNTRSRDHLPGPGAAVLTVTKQGLIEAISTDTPWIRRLILT
ncbi:MAG: hypothetical protein KDI36_09480 [Pseudomonadales bacterium]|nr:hypothetical protein [Pseudomonadales bacterium]